MKNRNRKAGIGVESLDSRTLLTGGVSITLVGGMVSIVGTSLGDTGSVRIEDGLVKVDMSNASGNDSASFPVSAVAGVLFSGKAGDDSFVNNTGLLSIQQGGDGNDSLTGGSGYDVLMGNAGNDRLLGGDGRDTLFDREGVNTLDGVAGSDVLIAPPDSLVNSDGSDTAFRWQRIG